MTEEIKSLWPTAGDLVAALRSGKYRQHTSTLCDVPTSAGNEVNTGLDKATAFCCIGVYGKLCRDRGISFNEDIDVYSACQKALGISTTELFLRNDGIEPHSKFDFNQIADFIEEHAK